MNSLCGLDGRVALWVFHTDLSGPATRETFANFSQL